MAKELLKEIECVFKNLGIALPPTEFHDRCQTINYKTNIALNAIKEFSIRLELTGEKMIFAWNEFMGGVEQTVETLTKWEVLHKKTILDFLEKDLLWLVGKNVLENDDPFKLIKLRL